MIIQFTDINIFFHIYIYIYILVSFWPTAAAKKKKEEETRMRAVATTREKRDCRRIIFNLTFKMMLF